MGEGDRDIFDSVQHYGAGDQQSLLKRVHSRGTAGPQRRVHVYIRDRGASQGRMSFEYSIISIDSLVHLIVDQCAISIPFDESESGRVFSTICHPSLNVSR